MKALIRLPLSPQGFGRERCRISDRLKKGADGGSVLVWYFSRDGSDAGVVVDQPAWEILEG